MKFRVENGEVFLKKWWFSKEISLKNITHIIESHTKLYTFYEGKKCICQCQWSFKSIELAFEVFKQPACQYIEYLRYEDEEEIDDIIINVNEQEEYVKCKENEVQEIIEKYNNEHKIKIKAEFGYDEHLGYYCYYISQDKEDAPWVFQCRPAEHHIWHKDTSKNEFYKCDYWKEQFKSDLKLLDKVIAKNNELFDTSAI